MCWIRSTEKMRLCKNEFLYPKRRAWLVEQSCSCRSCRSRFQSLQLFLVVLFFDQEQLRQRYNTPKVRLDRGSNSWPPDHDSTFHVTETPVLTTQPSVTLTSQISQHSSQFTFPLITSFHLLLLQYKHYSSMQFTSSGFSDIKWWHALALPEQWKHNRQQ